MHEMEESTRASYEMYARVHLYPAFGDEPSARSRPGCWRSSTPNCAAAAPAAPADRRRAPVDGRHECRAVRHRRRPGRPPLPSTRRTTVPGWMRGHRVPSARVHAALGRDGPADPLRGLAACSRRRSGGLDHPQPRRGGPQAPPAGAAAGPADCRAGGPDHRSGVGGGRRLGHARLAGHGDRIAARRAARAALVRRRSRDREGDRSPQLRADGGSRSRRTRRPTRCVGLRSTRRRSRSSRSTAPATRRACSDFDVTPTDEAFLFSYRPLHDRPPTRAASRHRYARMCADARHRQPPPRAPPLLRDRAALGRRRPPHGGWRLGHGGGEQRRCGSTPRGSTRPTSERPRFSVHECGGRIKAGGK